ncbi:phage antirepressor [Marinibaculum pumilum]|uniref:Phage antirepressor n=1 Tax=Marinibaculum pumilum TaxID=1766165 RepID=A0ABV7KZ92_9PROT
MNTTMQTFGFEGWGVRVVIRDGEPWFVLADVCRVLEIGNPSDAARRLDDDERGVDSIDTPSGVQEMLIINESGLYSLILTSRKLAAKRFKKWVTAEVLPTIRRTGGYGAAVVDMRDPVQLAAAAAQLVELNRDLQQRLDSVLPTVRAFERLAVSDGSLCITDAAKSLQVKPRELFRYLRAHAWIYSRGGQATEVAYQDKLNCGWLEHKVTTVTRTDGTEKEATQVRVTPKGLARLAKVFETGLQAALV